MSEIKFTNLELNHIVKAIEFMRNGDLCLSERDKKMNDIVLRKIKNDWIKTPKLKLYRNED